MKRKTTWQAGTLLLAICVLIAFGLVGSVSDEPTRGVVPTAVVMVGSDSARPFALPEVPLAYVDDRAAVLVPFRDRLERASGRVARASGIEFHVVTQQDSRTGLSELAMRNFELRAIDPTSVGAVVVLVETGAGRVAIRTSPQLRKLFPEFWLRLVEAHELAPFAQSRELGSALIGALARMNARAIERARIGQWIPPERVREREEFRRALDQLAGGTQASLPVPRGEVPPDLKHRLSRERRARYAPSTTVRGSTAAVLRMWAELAGDPTLELLTPGSQCMRARNAASPGEFWRRADAFEAAPPSVRERGDRAVVLPSESAMAAGTEPLLMERIEGLWHLDTASMAAIVRRMPAGGTGVRDRSNAYAFGLASLPLSPRPLPDADIGALDLAGEHPLDAVARLEAKLALEPSGDGHFELAELLFRNCSATADALAHYERAALLDPEDRHKVEVAANRALALELDLWATPYLRALGESHYERLADAYRNVGRFEEARHFYQLSLVSEPTPSAERALSSIASLAKSPGRQAR